MGHDFLSCPSFRRQTVRRGFGQLTKVGYFSNLVELQQFANHGPFTYHLFAEVSYKVIDLNKPSGGKPKMT